MSESTWKIVPYNAFCRLDHEETHINGHKVDSEDFVEQYDHYKRGRCDYGCGDMRAETIEPTQKVLEEYEITKDDYYIIANEIAEALTFGRCGWCI